MDIIYLHDLKVDCVIGIWNWERHTTQTIVFDIDLAIDASKAAVSDNIHDTLNYKAVAKRVIAFASESRFQLIETLAEKVAELIVTEFKTPWVRVRVNKKGAIRSAADVGVLIERGSKI